MAITSKVTFLVAFYLFLPNLSKCDLCEQWRGVLPQEKFSLLQHELQKVVNVSPDSRIYFSLCGRDKGGEVNFPSVCSNDSGICTIGTSAGRESLLWEVPSNVNAVTSKTGTRVILKAESTTNCTEAKNRIGNYGVEITFDCPEDTQVHAPVELSSSTPCLRRILWTTEFACTADLESSPSEPTTDNTGDIVGSGCKVKNPVLGHTYDLTKLSRVIEKQSEIGKFTVAVCKKPDFDCGEGIGGCLRNGSENFSYGLYNDELIYRKGTLLLTYENGATCDRDAKSNRTTLIQFICDHSDSDEVTLAHYDCQAHFHWKTKDACIPGRNITCQTTDSKGNIYDLTSLMAHTHNHETEHGNETYILNVCHTVVFGNGAECPSYAAGCLRTTNSYLSLGTLNQPPSVDEDGVLRLRYKGGDVCPEDKSKSISTQIDFECERGSKITAPEFVQYKDCTHYFSWKDNAACPVETKKKDLGTEKSEEPTEIICHVETSEGHIDLSNLTRKFVSHAVTSGDMPGVKFSLNVCRPVNNANEGCDGGAICLVTDNGTKIESLGRPVSAPVAVRGGVDLLYTHGGVCKNDTSYNYTSRIKFICDQNASAGRPVFEHHSHDCQYIFEWRTKFACPQLMESVPADCGLEDKLRDQRIDLSALQNIPEFQKSGICAGTAKNSTYEILPEMVMITYNTESLCNSGGHRVVEFLLKCDKEASVPIARRVQDQSCLLIVEVKTVIVCYLQDSGKALEEDKKPQVASDTSRSGFGVAIAWIVGILVISSIAIVVYKRRRTLAALWLRRRERGLSRRPRDDGVRYSEVPSNQEHEVLFGAIDSRNLHDDSDDELIGV